MVSLSSMTQVRPRGLCKPWMVAESTSLYVSFCSWHFVAVSNCLRKSVSTGRTSPTAPARRILLTTSISSLVTWAMKSTTRYWLKHSLLSDQYLKHVWCGIWRLVAPVGTASLLSVIAQRQIRPLTQWMVNGSALVLSDATGPTRRASLQSLSSKPWLLWVWRLLLLSDTTTSQPTAFRATIWLLSRPPSGRLLATWATWPLIPPRTIWFPCSRTLAMSLKLASRLIVALHLWRWIRMKMRPLRSANWTATTSMAVLWSVV